MKIHPPSISIGVGGPVNEYTVILGFMWKFRFYDMTAETGKFLMIMFGPIKIVIVSRGIARRDYELWRTNRKRWKEINKPPGKHQA